MLFYLQNRSTTNQPTKKTQFDILSYTTERMHFLCTVPSVWSQNNNDFPGARWFLRDRPQVRCILQQSGGSDRQG